MSDAKASFVNGYYRIRPNLSPAGAAVAASHEEAHGIIRRSTLYGFLLSAVLSAEKKFASADNVLAQVLLSKGRTSEEIFATFYSITWGLWVGSEHGTAHLAERELAAHPEYTYYYQLGKDLAADFSSPLAKIVVVDGIVRFCWSSERLGQFLDRSSNWSDVLSLPSLAFPDKRMAALRADWFEPSGIRATIRERLSSMEKIIGGKSSSELHDPFHEFAKGGIFMSDNDPEVIKKRNENAVWVAMLTETSAIAVADALCENYDSTPMSGRRTQDVHKFIIDNRKRSAASSSNAFKQPWGIIEQVENLPKRHRARRVSKPGWIGGNELPMPILGLRSWRSFSSNFELPDDLHNLRKPESDVLYLTAYSGPLDAGDEEAVLPIAIYPGPVANLSRLLDWIPPPAIMAVWTSLMLPDCERWISCFRALSRRNYRIWLVVDTEPQTVVRSTRSLLPEVNAFFDAPLRDRPNLGGLIVRGLEGVGADVVRGLIFMGLQNTVSYVVAMLRRDLGDDFRGLNPIEIIELSVLRGKEGIAIVNWLMANEHVFSYMMEQ
jgi:hypothetical protein